VIDPLSAHDAALFFSWHRYFVHVYEKSLHEHCGYNGTFPYVALRFVLRNVLIALIDTGIGQLTLMIPPALLFLTLRLALEVTETKIGQSQIMMHIALTKAHLPTCKLATLESSSTEGFI
jgi:hypothetical protein